MSKKILIFGDSIAKGAFDSEGGGWADRLKLYFVKDWKYSVMNLGISGNDTRDILKRIDPECEARNPSYIIFAVGVNDAALEGEQARVTKLDFKKKSY